MDGWLVGGLVREREYGAGSLLVRGYRERSCIYNSNSISRAIYNFVNIFTLMKIFQHGPIDDTYRKCTNLNCLIFYLILTVLLFIFFIIAMLKGTKLEPIPIDPDGHQCLPPYPYLYYTSPSAGNMRRVCVERCPAGDQRRLKCKTNSLVKSCGQQGNTMGVTLYDSKPSAGNICLPTSKYLQKTLMRYLPTSKTLDLLNSWPVLLICLGTSIMIGIVFMLLMRWNEGCVVWTLMYAGIAVLFILGVLLVWPKEMTSRGVRVLEIILGVVCFVLAVVIVMVMGYRWRDVEAWGRLMHTANKLIASDQLTFSFPLTMSIISLLLLLLWLTIGSAFSSTGSYHLQNHHPTYKLHPLWTTLLLLHLLYTLTSVSILLDTSTFLVSGFTTNWYFRVDGCFERARTRLRKFHMGSVVLGAVMGVVVGPVKFLFDCAMGNLREANEIQESCPRKVCGCCITQLFRRYNSGAYFRVHMSAEQYCYASSNILSLQIRSPHSQGGIPLTCKIFKLLSSLTLTAPVCLLSYYLLTHTHISTVSHPFFTTLFIGLLSMLTVWYFVSLYADAVESLYLSFLMEMDVGGIQGNCPREVRESLIRGEKEIGSRRRTYAAVSGAVV